MHTSLVKNDKIAVRAYQGDAMTLLAFDSLQESDRKDFVGFTIELKNKTMPEFKALNNRIGFTPPPTELSEEEKKKLKNPSTEAPFQKFRWIHVLRNFTKTGDEPFFGEYQYRITPRYFVAGKLDDFDKDRPKDSVVVSLEVKPFEKNGISLALLL
jgi:hypothetical protein